MTLDQFVTGLKIKADAGGIRPTLRHKTIQFRGMCALHYFTKTDSGALTDRASRFGIKEHDAWTIMSANDGVVYGSASVDEMKDLRTKILATFKLDR